MTLWVAAVSGEVGKEDLIKYLEERIERLRRELSILEKLLSLVKEEAAEAEVTEEGEARPESVKVVSSKGNVIADIVKAGGRIKVVFTETLPANKPAVKAFLLKLLDDLVDEGVISSYRVNERKGFITGIEVLGNPPRRFYKDLELAIRYVWSEIRGNGGG